MIEKLYHYKCKKDLIVGNDREKKNSKKIICTMLLESKNVGCPF